jgi:hypothetical protein
MEEQEENKELEELKKKIKKIRMPKGIEWLDCIITLQLIIIIIIHVKINNNYAPVIVYFSAVVFIGYWLIRIVFNPNVIKNNTFPLP